MNLFLACARLQGQLVASNRDYLLELVRAPLLTVVFVALVLQSGRTDLVVNAVLAPVLTALWGIALFVSGEIVDADRWLGTLEPTVSTPSSFSTVVLNRVTASTLISLAVIVEVWLVAVPGFGLRLAVHHPVLFVVALLATVAATVGTATLMASVFVATRTARTFQNSLSYPMLLLGGVFVPVSMLPEWIRPVTRILYLSWSADLLRDCVRAAPVGDFGARVAMILLLGGAGLAAGWYALHAALGRLRGAGSIGLR